MDGIQVASLTGAVLTGVATFIVYKYLPHTITQQGAAHGPVEAAEDIAELALGGMPPVFADEASFDGQLVGAAEPMVTAPHH